jgi:hypothetical protein
MWFASFQRKFWCLFFSNILQIQKIVFNVPQKNVIYSHGIVTIAGVTKNFEPGWKLTRGSFFNVEYWTLGAFSPLKIETESRWKYTRGHFSTALDVYFFLISDDPETLNIDPVEYWLPTTELWIVFLYHIYSPCNGIYFGRGERRLVLH